MTAPSHPVPGRVPDRVPGRVPGSTDGALRTAVVTSSVGVLAVAVLRLALARSWVGTGELLPWAAALLVAGSAALVLSPDRTAVLAARGLAAGGALAGPAFTDDELAAIDQHAVDAGINLWKRSSDG